MNRCSHLNFMGFISMVRSVAPYSCCVGVVQLVALVHTEPVEQAAGSTAFPTGFSSQSHFTGEYGRREFKAIRFDESGRNKVDVFDIDTDPGTIKLAAETLS